MRGSPAKSDEGASEDNESYGKLHRDCSEEFG
jgi:hypothetical protein